MKVVSSQDYIDWDIVEEKKAEMIADKTDKVVLPCWEIGEVEGVEMAILADGHHRYQAAKELGIDVEFDFIDEPEGLTGEEALDAHYNNCDWYYVETSDLSECHYDMVW